MSPLLQLCKDLELRGQLEQRRSELAPLEKKYLEVAQRSDRHREIVTWGGEWVGGACCVFLGYLIIKQPFDGKNNKILKHVWQCFQIVQSGNRCASHENMLYSYG